MDASLLLAGLDSIGEASGLIDEAACIHIDAFDSPLGPLLIGATERAICLVEFADRKAIDRQVAGLRRQFHRPVISGKNSLTDQAQSELTDYFAGRRRNFSLPLAYPGTVFQNKVWTALLEIPYGQTCAYEAIALAVTASANTCRAVGQANGLNRVAILIPCHRVVNKDGKLSGYAGGLWRKRFLLDLERKCRLEG